MTKNDTQLLTEFLKGPKRPTGTLQFNELQGFLFTIASSPETIPTSEWLALISDGEDIGFADDDEADQFLNGTMALYNDVNTSVLERSQNLPHGCNFADELDADLDADSSIGQWSRGFLVGHNWLADVWEEYLIEEMDEECGAAMMVLSFFSSRQLAEAYYDDGRPTRRNPDKSFEDFANTMRELFPSAMASYAHMGRTIFEVLLENTDAAEPRN
jgi:yecA family protein